MRLMFSSISVKSRFCISSCTKTWFRKLSLSFSESTQKMLHNGGVESVWGALGVCFLRVSHMGNHTKSYMPGIWFLRIVHPNRSRAIFDFLPLVYPNRTGPKMFSFFFYDSSPRAGYCRLLPCFPPFSGADHFFNGDLHNHPVCLSTPLASAGGTA